MSIIVNEGESKPRLLPPAGTHVARCYSIIDLGTQTIEYMGEEKDLHQVRVTWELPEEKAVFKEENGEQPFVLSKDYTLSLYEKANLRRDLESWRGRQFTEAELAGFDISKLIGVPCLLSVVHKTTQKGKTFANISSVSALAKGMACPKQVNPNVEYSITDGSNDVFRSFPDWLKKKIEEAHEWGNGHTPPASTPADDDDEIPF